MNNDIDYIAGFMPAADATALFQALKDGTKWHSELKTVDGGSAKLKRQMAYIYDRPVDYKYANMILPGAVWTDDLTKAKELVEAGTNRKFNSVLLNLYEDGKDTIRWHADKETQIGPNPVIVTLNLGATRIFHMLKKETGEKFQYPLTNGDVLVMKENCQQNWLHAILPEKGVKEPRISLTFRWVYDDLID